MSVLNKGYAPDPDWAPSANLRGEGRGVWSEAFDVRLVKFGRGLIGWGFGFRTECLWFGVQGLG